MKKVDWVLLIISSLCGMGMYYGFRFFVLEQRTFYRSDHLTALFCGFLMFSVMYWLFYVSSGGSLHNRKSTWWKLLFGDFIGGLTGFAVLFGFMLYAGGFLGGSEPLAYKEVQDLAEIQQRVKIANMILFSSVIYYWFCALVIWSRYTVKEDTLIFRNGKILYPGTDYRIFFGILDKGIDIASSQLVSKITIEPLFTDGVFKVSFATNVKIDTERAKQQNIGTFDVKTVKEEARIGVSKIILPRLHKMTFGQFITEKELQFGPISATISGVPIIWNGKIWPNRKFTFN